MSLLIFIQRKKNKRDCLEIQELVARGRILFSGASARLEVFKLVNGKRSAKEIARKLGRSLTAILNDLLKMKDLELIFQKMDKNGKPIRKGDSIVYEKAPLIRHIPVSFFEDSTRIAKQTVKAKALGGKAKSMKLPSLQMPSETEILDICRHGEDQIYEFKAAGTDIQKLTKECAAFANTKLGGIIFYGVEDDGTIAGTDKRKQELDQPLQNSIRNAILPSLVIDIVEKDVLGHKIILIRVPAWNRKDVYQYEGRVYIRLGTNAFIAKPEQTKKLHKGIPIV
jgi:predicted HTH transcriptional regulator